MAGLTPQQLQQAGGMLAGTFDKLDTSPRMQPGYSVDQVYQGIIPSGGDPGKTANRSDPVGPGSDWNTMTGFADDPGYGGQTVNSGQVRVADALRGPSGTTLVGKDESRLPQGLTDAMAYGEASAPPPAVRAITAATQPVMRPANGGAWFGGWGSDAIGRFLAGDHGQVDYSRAAPDTTDAFGKPYSPAVMQALQAPVAAPVMRSPQPKPATMASNLNPGVSRFLSEKGQSSAGMTPGEQANAFNKSIF